MKAGLKFEDLATIRTDIKTMLYLKKNASKKSFSGRNSEFKKAYRLVFASCDFTRKETLEVMKELLEILTAEEERKRKEQALIN
jgi:hypothetical protein